MSRDIQADHFVRDDNKPNGGVKLSDQRIDLIAQGWYPPLGGFFRIVSGTPAATYADSDNN